MDFIIAPIAGKPATSRSLIIVPADIQTISMQFDPDVRLAAAAGGVARYFADAAELDHALVSQLQASIVAVCKQEFGQSTAGSARLEVTLTRLPDRIEIVVKRQAAEGSRDSEKTPANIAGIDQVQQETQGDAAITRLIKYVGQSASGA
jgi:hypothetical protein